MLVLTVKPHEKVFLTMPDGREIVLEVTKGLVAVSLGIDAPKDVAIVRGEVRKRAWFTRSGEPQKK